MIGSNDIFLEKIMTKLGFHSNWISFVMHCVTTVSYTVMKNRQAMGSYDKGNFYAHICFSFVIRDFPLCFVWHK